MFTEKFTNIRDMKLYTPKAVERLRKQWELDKVTKTKPCVICSDPIEDDKVICRKCAHAIFIGSFLVAPSRQCGKDTLKLLVLKDIMDYEFGIDVGKE